MNPRRKILESDLSRAETRKRSFSKVERKIDEYLAPVESVLEWYHSQDPTDEQWNLEHLKSIGRLTSSVKGSPYAESWEMMLEADKRAMDLSGLYTKASVILLGNLVRPDLIGGRRPRMCKIQETFDVDDPYELLLSLKPEVSALDTNRENIQQIGIAADMLALAAMKFSMSGVGTGWSFYRKMQDIGGYEYVRNLPKKTKINMLNLSEDYYGIGFSAAYEHIDDPKMAKLCVQLLVKHVARKLNDAKPRSLDAQEGLDQLLRVCQHLLEKGTLEDLDDGVQKGFWHEIIWYLDFNVLRQINKNKLRIVPAKTFEDSPHNDKPELNRGFDYVITGKKFIRNIQLKSSKRAARGKQPHPTIDNVVESDFDYSPDGIKQKLELYQKFIDLSFPKRMNVEILSAILESVKLLNNNVQSEMKRDKDSPMQRLNQEYEEDALVHPSLSGVAQKIGKTAGELMLEVESDEFSLREFIYNYFANPNMARSQATIANRALRRASKKRNS